MYLYLALLNYNGTEGVRALEFIKDQIDAGITPQKEHFWGKEFLDRKFAVMLEALQHHIPPPAMSESKNLTFDASPLFTVTIATTCPLVILFIGGRAFSSCYKYCLRPISLEEPKLFQIYKQPYYSKFDNMSALMIINKGNSSLLVWIASVHSHYLNHPRVGSE
jgi:hypothetical protein